MTSVRVSVPDESGLGPAYDVGDLVPRILHATAALRGGAPVDELDRRLLRHAATELLIALARPAPARATEPAPATGPATTPTSAQDGRGWRTRRRSVPAGPSRS